MTLRLLVLVMALEIEMDQTLVRRASPLPLITNTILPINDSITTVSNYVEFRTTETSPTRILCSRTSDFPLKNAPCKSNQFFASLLSYVSTLLQLVCSIVSFFLLFFKKKK
jgi:hypothetical protein